MIDLGRRYALWVAEETEPGASTATLSPAGYETADADAAMDWAESFNRRELAEPVGAWAVVRAVDS